MLTRKPALDFAARVLPERRVDPVVVIAVATYVAACIYYLVAGV